MSYLGRYYVSMEQDKTELEKVLNVYSAAKQIKYIYDEKNKLIPVDRIGKIGKGVCYDYYWKVYIVNSNLINEVL